MLWFNPSSKGVSKAPSLRGPSVPSFLCEDSTSSQISLKAEPATSTIDIYPCNGQMLEKFTRIWSCIIVLWFSSKLAGLCRFPPTPSSISTYKWQRNPILPLRMSRAHGELSNILLLIGHFHDRWGDFPNSSYIKWARQTWLFFKQVVSNIIQHAGAKEDIGHITASPTIILFIYSNDVYLFFCV